MSDTARRIFPTETVLALIMGKDDVDVKEIAGYVADCSIICPTCAKVAGAMAAGHIARGCAKINDLNMAEGQSWEDFVAAAKKELGDKISLTKMPAAQAAAVDSVLAKLRELVDLKNAQAAEIAALQAKVDELSVFEAKAAELAAKVSKQEDTIKTMKTDMNGLRKQLVPFTGKIALSQDELMQTIKDAIKDNMKGFAVAGAGAAAGAAAEEAVEEAAAENSVPDDFGFGASGANSDGFGF